MKSVLKVTINVCLLVCFSAFGQSLWQMTSVGMSIEQVHKLYPEANLLESSPNNTYPNGSVELLKLNEINIVRNPFSVAFCFKEQKLFQVIIKSRNVDKQSIYELYTVLTSKYGKPINELFDRPIKTTEWISGKTNIYMMVIHDSVQIGYEASISKEADKL